MGRIVLFESKESCCGCGACLNISLHMILQILQEAWTGRKLQDFVKNVVFSWAGGFCAVHFLLS